MPARKVEDLVAYHFALEFRDEVYELMNGSPRASRDYKFKDQLFDAVSGVDGTIAEGFCRRNPAEFATFLRYALASLAEAVTRLGDGTARGYFPKEATLAALTWADRCKSATRKLYFTQNARAELRRKKKRNRPQSPKPLPPKRRNT